MFIKLLKEITINGATLPVGAVVETDKVRRKTLVERGHAVDVEGPAPGPDTSPRPSPDERGIKVEKAVKRS